MKKVLSILLAVMLLVSLFALPASAESVTEGYVTNVAAGASLSYDTETKKYTAVYESADLIAGNEYVLLVVKGTPSNYSVGNNTIMDIRQTASGSGSITFTFAPKAVPECVVLLGGEFASGTSPVVLGTLVGQGVSVSGKIQYQGGTAHVELYDSTNAMVAEADTNTSGVYTLDGVPEGSGYYLKVSKLGFLTYTYTGVTVKEGQALPDVDISAFGGDVNENGGVYANDFQAYLTDFNKDVPAEFNYAASDLNGSGSVYANDFSILLAGFNKTTEDAHN